MRGIRAEDDGVALHVFVGPELLSIQDDHSWIVAGGIGHVPRVRGEDDESPDAVELGSLITVEDHEMFVVGGGVVRDVRGIRAEDDVADRVIDGAFLPVDNDLVRPAVWIASLERNAGEVRARNKQGRNKQGR